MNIKKAFGSISLLLAAIIWGFAFVAQTSGAETIPTFTFNFLRSYIAVIFLGAVIGIASIKDHGIIPRDKSSKRSLIIGGICCGIALFIATSFQQYGISLYPASAGASGRSGFITALYVVLVPCVSALIFRRRIHPLVWIGVIVAVVGMYLLCFGGGLEKLYIGDIMVFFCALSFCGHILVVDHFVEKNNGILLSCLQFLTMGTLSLISMLIFEDPSLDAILDSLIPLLYLGIMSSGVAYTLQLVGQKHTDPTVASILMSLESVFAVIGGWMILGERLTARELIGCSLVFLAIIVAQAPGFKKKNKFTNN